MQKSPTGQPRLPPGHQIALLTQLTSVTAGKQGRPEKGVGLRHNKTHGKLDFGDGGGYKSFNSPKNNKKNPACAPWPLGH